MVRILAALGLIPIAALFLSFILVFIVGTVALFGAIILGILLGFSG